MHCAPLLDLRDVVREHGLVPPSDEERHTLSSWGEAVYDVAGEPLLFSSPSLARSKLLTWCRSHLGTTKFSTAATAMRKAAMAHVHRHCPVLEGAAQSVVRAESAGDKAAKTSALRLHCDTSDYELSFTSIQELRDVRLGGGRLTMDVWASELDAARRLAVRHPSNAEFTSCEARVPSLGTVSPYTLTRLPRRFGELSLGGNMFTVMPVHDRPHFVGRCWRCAAEGGA